MLRKLFFVWRKKTLPVICWRIWTSVYQKFVACKLTLGMLAYIHSLRDRAGPGRTGGTGPVLAASWAGSAFRDLAARPALEEVWSSGDGGYQPNRSARAAGAVSARSGGAVSRRTADVTAHFSDRWTFGGGGFLSRPWLVAARWADVTGGKRGGRRSEARSGQPPLKAPAENCFTVGFSVMWSLGEWKRDIEKDLQQHEIRNKRNSSIFLPLSWIFSSGSWRYVSFCILISSIGCICKILIGVIAT